MSLVSKNGGAVVKMSPKVKQQLIIMAICRVAEPVALTSVYPYLYFMVGSFGIPKKDIAFWVGVTSASFSFSQFTSGLWWGRASDRFGRKYPILAGLFGTFMSLIVFGFAKSLPVAIAARCMAGVLNGNVGIMRTFVAEIVTEKELQPRAFSLMPLIWAVGSIFGPIIGGYLSDPVANHPDYFSPGGLFSRYPYALPNLFGAFLISIGIVVCFLFLEESLESQKHRRDIGRELGRKLTSIFRRNKHGHREALLQDESSPLLIPADEEHVYAPKTSTAPQTHKVTRIRDAFTTFTTRNIVVYAFLALQSVGFDQLALINLSYPHTLTRDPNNVLKFFGGFGLSSPEIGSFFSMIAISAVLNQFFIFPLISAKYGVLFCMKCCVFIFLIIDFLFPFTVFVPETYQNTALFIVVFCKQMAGVFAFPCCTILLTNSAPSLRVLGTLNGIATATAALGRAIGPTMAGAAFSYGQRVDCLILPWWLLCVVTLVGGLPAWWLVEGEAPKKEEVQPVERANEAAIQSGFLAISSEREHYVGHSVDDDEGDGSEWLDEEDSDL